MDNDLWEIIRPKENAYSPDVYKMFVIKINY